MTLDEEDIQRVAERVVELLGTPYQPASGESAAGPVLARERPQPAPSGLVDAATLARMLGVDRSWVYAHAAQLGGIRLGGPQGRLRFDLARLTDRLCATPAGPPAPRPAGRRRPRRPPPAGACTTTNARPRISPQSKMAGRRTNAPGPTPGG
jgi:hypothetical protein